MPHRRRLTPPVIGRLAAGWLLVGGGAVLTPLPVPVGLLLVATGLLLLARDSVGMRRRLRRLRARFPALSGRIAWLARRAPPGLARLIRLTEPRRESRHAERFRNP